MKGKKKILKLKLFGLPKKQNISYHDSHIWPLCFGKGHCSLPVGGQNLNHLAKMARGTWNLMLVYVPTAVFTVAVLVTSLGWKRRLTKVNVPEGPQLQVSIDEQPFLAGGQVFFQW